MPGQVGALPEHHSSMLCIRTGDIQFVGCNSIATIQFIHHFSVFVFAEPENIDEYGAADRAQKWHLVANKGIDADVLQANGVEHSRSRWEKPGRKISVQGASRSTFNAD